MTDASIKPQSGVGDVGRGVLPSSDLKLQDLDAEHQENAVGYREYLEAMDLEVSDKELRRLRWKLDLTILPMFLVTQALQFMDKTSLNYANLFGYQAALKLQGQQFNYLSAMVYAGYFFGQYPCGWLIGRYPAQRVMAISIFFWGLMVILMTQTRTYSSALGVRFIMGIFEAAVTPWVLSKKVKKYTSNNKLSGLTLMTGFWYTRQEIPLRQCIWYSSLGWGGIIGSYISMGVSKLPADLKPERWELIFFMLGGVTCVWSLVIWFLLPDSPSNAFFLSHRERLLAVKRVSENETGIKNKAFDKKQALLGSVDPKTLLLFTSVFAAAIPNGVVNSFSTIIIRDMGFSTTQTTQLKSVGDAVQIIALLIGGTVILNVKDSRLITASVANLLCTISAACMAYLPESNTWGRLVSFWLVNSQSVGFTVSLTTISSNMAGYTHRSLASAMVFTAYCWGNFAGPFVVKQPEAPHFRGATIGLLVGYAIKLICHLTLLIYLYLVNHHRDKRYGEPNRESSKEAGMRDQTEFENKDFRYVL
ncbi:putative transporter [Colletotrichum siamense]|uniref:Transporter n=1 Tax=Colletotrichum siamense TaxID=690259 RepID=A0A9P5K5Y5_COLSI|nr:putative transporter [Colletotrichum siamense]KAF4859356.1 putative transporter [Colletotrichum siamense]